MVRVKEELNIKFNEFWFEIDKIEQIEIKNLKEYLDYVKNLKRNHIYKTEFERIESLFINKQLDYANEAFYSIILGNQNAFACLIRIMIENYVSFVLIKKYKQKEIWKDWYLWSFKKEINNLKSHKNNNLLEKQYRSLCKEMNVAISDISINQSYGWLNRVVNLKKYNFKSACGLVDKNIYNDFSCFSKFIHNTDLLAKMTWLDQTSLTKCIYSLYFYLNCFIDKYDDNFVKKHKYMLLVEKLLYSLNCVLHDV